MFTTICHTLNSVLQTICTKLYPQVLKMSWGCFPISSSKNSETAKEYKENSQRHNYRCFIFDQISEGYFSSVQLLSRVWLFVTPWTTACQASLSIANSWSLPKPMSIESVMAFNHVILWRPLLLQPSILPKSGSIQMSQLFASSGQSIGVSASRQSFQWTPRTDLL